MTNLREVYRCSICGNVLDSGGPSLVCCNKPIKKCWQEVKIRRL